MDTTTEVWVTMDEGKKFASEHGYSPWLAARLFNAAFTGFFPKKRDNERDRPYGHENSALQGDRKLRLDEFVAECDERGYCPPKMGDDTITFAKFWLAFLTNGSGS